MRLPVISGITESLFKRPAKPHNAFACAQVDSTRARAAATITASSLLTPNRWCPAIQSPPSRSALPIQADAGDEQVCRFLVTRMRAPSQRGASRFRVRDRFRSVRASRPARAARPALQARRRRVNGVAASERFALDNGVVARRAARNSPPSAARASRLSEARLRDRLDRRRERPSRPHPNSDRQDSAYRQPGESWREPVHPPARSAAHRRPRDGDRRRSQRYARKRTAGVVIWRAGEAHGDVRSGARRRFESVENLAMRKRKR